MALVRDETLCAPLCQHPSCWNSAARLSKGRPRRHLTSVEQSDSSDEECGLPTQNIVNLLEDYGDSPYDRYPSAQSSFERPSLSTALKERHTTRASFPTVPPPRGSPASMHPKVVACTPAPILPSPPKKLGKIEVQEVFDLEELNRGWQDTFMTKQYYVWVPNPNRQNKPPPKSHILSTGLRDSGEENQGITLVPQKDLTQQMMPRDINRAHTSSILRGFWPILMQRKSQCRSPPSRQLRTANRRPISPAQQYYGVYDLLNLPKDELAKILDQFNESDRSTLMTYLPTLERHKKEAMTLAQGSVLKQRKMELLSDRQPYKPSHLGEQVFVMDGDMFGTMSGSASTGGQHRTRETQTTPRLLGYRNKAPLPPVPRTGRDADTPEGMTSHLPSVTLGLPRIPPGQRITQPFTYKSNDFDFTLGPYHSEMFDVPYGGEEDRHSSPPISKQSSKLTITLPRDDKTVTQDDGTEKITSSGGQQPVIQGVSDSPHVPQAPHSTPHAQQDTPTQDNKQPQPGVIEPHPPSSVMSSEEVARQAAISRRAVRFAPRSPNRPVNTPRGNTPPPPQAPPNTQPTTRSTEEESGPQVTSTLESDGQPTSATVESGVLPSTSEEAMVTSSTKGEVMTTVTVEENHSLEAQDGSTEPPATVQLTSPSAVQTPAPPVQVHAAAPTTPEPSWPAVTEESINTVTASSSDERIVHAVASSPAALMTGSAGSRMSVSRGERPAATSASMPRLTRQMTSPLPGSGSATQVRSSHSRESMLSDKAMRAMQDGGPADSPAPPPPSPEQKVECHPLDDIEEAHDTDLGTAGTEQQAEPLAKPQQSSQPTTLHSDTQEDDHTAASKEVAAESSTTAYPDSAVNENDVFLPQSYPPPQPPTASSTSSIVPPPTQVLPSPPAPIVIPTSDDIELEAALEDAEAQLMAAVSQLDEFDGNDAAYKEELKNEYDKLSSKGSRDGSTSDSTKSKKKK